MRVGMRSDGPDLVPEIATDRVLELGSLGRVLWRRKWWVLGPTLIAAALAFVGVNLLTPRYKSEARILIEERESVFLRPEAEKTGDRAVVDQEAVTSQVQLALSRDLARQVIRQLKLGERPEFDPVLRGVNPLAQVLRLIGLAKDPLRMTPEERVLDAYYDRLEVFPVEKSRVFHIGFQSADPDLAASVANAVAEGYVGRQREAKHDEMLAAGQWLDGEIGLLRRKVDDAEKAIEGFRAQSNLLVGTNNTTLSNQQLGELNSQLAAALSQKAEMEAKARFIRESLRSGRPLESAEFLNSEGIRRLVEQRATLRAQLAEQSSTLLDAHPRIKELKAQVAELEREIRMEAERLARSLENDARIADARVSTLSTNLDQLKQRAASTNRDDVKLRALERDAKAQRELLESYLAKRGEISSRENLGAIPSDVRIISRAVASSTPFFPRKLPIVLIATFATMVLAVGFITTGALLAGDVYRPIAPSDSIAADLAEPEAPPLAASHQDGFEPGRAGPHAPPHGKSAEHVVGAMASAIRGAGEGGRRIVVAGAARKAGTTFAALELARALAQDARVVLVELALGHPSLGPIAADSSGLGIADLVRGAVSFGEIITRDRFSRAHLVPAGRAGPDSAAILASERLGVALDALARTYDHLVIDAGALPDIALESLNRGAPRAVLVTTRVPPEAAAAARDRLTAAGFADVTVFEAPPPVPEAGVHADAA